MHYFAAIVHVVATAPTMGLAERGAAHGRDTADGLDTILPGQPHPHALKTSAGPRGVLHALLRLLSSSNAAATTVFLRLATFLPDVVAKLGRPGQRASVDGGLPFSDAVKGDSSCLPEWPTCLAARMSRGSVAVGQAAQGLCYNNRSSTVTNNPLCTKGRPVTGVAEPKRFQAT